MMKSRLLGAVGIVAVVGGIAGVTRVPVRAQSDAKPLAFEVATVKLNKSGDRGGSLRRQPGGRVDAVNMPLRMLITFAYQLQPFRLVGGPSWLPTDRFDIIAKLDGDPPPVLPGTGPDALATAMQTLLADRFQLKVHHETRDLDIYALVLARPNGNPGPALKRSTQDCVAAAGRGGAPPSSPAVGVFCGMQISPGRVAFGGLPLSQFGNGLSGQVGRVVVDRTGLDGNWDFELAYAAAPPVGLVTPGSDTPPPSDPDAPSIFTALQEQLGLKLESTKGPVDVLVIDSVEHPTEN